MTKISLGSYDFRNLTAPLLELMRLERQALACWPLERRLLNDAGVTEGSTVHDVGCGPGIVSRLLAIEVGSSGQVIGVEPNAELLETARIDLQTSTGNLEFLGGDLYALSDIVSDIEFAYLRMVVQHLEHPQEAFSALRRAMKPGGRVCVLDADDGLFSLMPPSEDLAHLFHLSAASQRGEGGDRHIGRKLPYYLKMAGFRDVSSRVELVTTDMLTKDAFVDLTLSFRARAAVGCAEEAERLLDGVLEHFRRDDAYGQAGVYFVTARA